MRRINTEALSAVIILLGIALLLFAALVTGGIHEYVHPRLDVWLWLTVPSLILVAISFARNIKRPRRNPNLRAYTILFIPLLCAAFLPAVSYSTSQVQFSGMNTLTSDGQVAVDTATETQSKETLASQAVISTTPIPSDELEEVTEGLTISDNMVIEDEQFSLWLMSVNENMDAYEGVTVTYKGQVVRDASFADNEFVPARMLMWCCAADIVPYGFLCRYDDAQNFSDDTWVLVTAVMHIEEYDGDTMPILYATSVEETTAPNDIYIYGY